MQTFCNSFTAKHLFIPHPNHSNGVLDSFHCPPPNRYVPSCTLLADSPPNVPFFGRNMSCIVPIAIVSPLSGIALPTVFITANGYMILELPWGMLCGMIVMHMYKHTTEKSSIATEHLAFKIEFYWCYTFSKWPCGLARAVAVVYSLQAPRHAQCMLCGCCSVYTNTLSCVARAYTFT